MISGIFLGGALNNLDAVAAATVLDAQGCVRPADSAAPDSRPSRGGRLGILLLCLFLLPGLSQSASAEEEGAPGVLSRDQGEPAQSQIPDEEESEEAFSYAGIEEVTVTARRREERLQETPVSVTAFDASAIQSRGVTELSELARYTPGLWFQSSAAQENSANVFIRGVGQTEGTINADPKVGIYLDDVYQSRSLGVDLSTWDVMRVEVIRGPQGALFGKNAIGGAVQILTVPPGPEYEARAQVELGNYWERAVRLTLNAPVDILGLGDKLFARGNLIYDARDGYVFDVNLQEYFSSKNLIGGRAALRFLPTDELDIRLAYWRSHRPVRSSRGDCELRADPDESGQGFLNSFNQVGPWPDLPVAEIVGGDFVTECDRSWALHSSTNVPNHEVLDTTKLYGTILWDTPEMPVLGSIATKSITAYQALGYQINLEVDSTALPLLQAIVPEDRHRQFSQELQFSGWGFGERLEWTLGLYYLGEATYGSPNEVHAMVPNFRLVDAPWVPYLPIEADATVLSRTQQQTASGYAFVDFEVIDSLTASAGFRYGWEQKSLERETDLAIYGWLASTSENPPLNKECLGKPGSFRECVPWLVMDGIIQIGKGVPAYSYGQARDDW
ncbi:MAG: TonB-dependent receptor plug domain-containing protein, partial [Myxococcota bacterium]|nr:TonB-dependent receptor plug domain-containing protein [Myxococcota bacterium]